MSILEQCQRQVPFQGSFIGWLGQVSKTDSTRCLHPFFLLPEELMPSTPNLRVLIDYLAGTFP